jgi:hypothetical protein
MGILEDLFRKDAVWLKGVAMLGRDPSEWRMDAYGGIMRYAEYGQTSIFSPIVDVGECGSSIIE